MLGRKSILIRAKINVLNQVMPLIGFFSTAEYRIAWRSHCRAVSSFKHEDLATGTACCLLNPWRVYGKSSFILDVHTVMNLDFEVPLQVSSIFTSFHYVCTSF